jgi:hypothetical protein
VIFTQDEDLLGTAAFVVEGRVIEFSYSTADAPFSNAFSSLPRSLPVTVYAVYVTKSLKGSLEVGEHIRVIVPGTHQMIGFCFRPSLVYCLCMFLYM